MECRTLIPARKENKVTSMTALVFCQKTYHEPQNKEGNPKQIMLEETNMGIQEV